ncbi:MAG: sugar ABC transporter permease [Caldilineaceae bacterium]
MALARLQRFRDETQQPTRRGKISHREELQFYLFISPWLIGFIFFTGGPVLASMGISLTDWSVLKDPTFVGVGNYVEMFAKDPYFVRSLVNTIYFVGVSIPLGMILSFLVAIMLNQKIWGITLFRTFFYLPSLVTGVAVAVLWAWLLNPQFGLINYVLRIFGVEGPEWLFNTKTAMPAMIVMSLWGIGSTVLIYLAGLQGIPEHLYEAAEIDGANTIQKFRNVTVPLMTPVIFFNVIVGIIGSFQTFTQFYVMTNGGPANATLVYVLYLYRNAFEYFKMGYASALAWVLFFVILTLTAIQFYLAQRWVYYEGDTARR